MVKSNRSYLEYYSFHLYLINNLILNLVKSQKKCCWPLIVNFRSLGLIQWSIFSIYSHKSIYMGTLFVSLLLNTIQVSSHQSLTHLNTLLIRYKLTRKWITIRYTYIESFACFGPRHSYYSFHKCITSYISSVATYEGLLLILGLGQDSNFK